MSSCNSLKSKIKCWEQAFEKQYNKKPSKNDIKNAPPDVYKCYKEYMAMKKKLCGVDIFGSELNKVEPMPDLNTPVEKVAVKTPNLRLKPYPKKNAGEATHPSPMQESSDANLLKDLGFQEQIPVATELKSPMPIRARSFASNRNSDILKNLRKAEESLTEGEVDSKVEGSSETAADNISHSSTLETKEISFSKAETTAGRIECSNARTNINPPDNTNLLDKDQFNFQFDALMSNDESKENHVSQNSVNERSEVSMYQDSSQLEIDEALLESNQPAKKRKKLECKPASSTQAEDDGNFVRLNMKSKRYRNPGKHMTGEAYKRKQWKSRGLFGKGPPKDWKNPDKKPNPPKWVTGEKSKPGKCFKCGEEGHWASKCPGKKPEPPKEITQEERAAREELDFSSLEPMIKVGKMVLNTDENEPISDPLTACKPLLDGSQTDDEIEEMLTTGLQDLGYSSFRYGQRNAVLRILRGESTLLVLSTGSGKSLVYQLAAYLYYKHMGTITLVISPLISLMNDQIQSLPAKLPGKCVHSHMSSKQKKALKDDISAGKVPLLLLSPESLMAGSFGSLPREMPRIGFVCIDEAHCLSSWSDNFRPAYLQVCDMLRSRYAVSCFLGLTATCTAASSRNVCSFIGVRGEEGVLRGPVVRENLYLTASADQDRDRALTALLQGERFKDLGSIIVYCTRRQQCERIATLLRTTLPPWAPEEEELCNKKTKRKRKSLDNSTAESYHAGMTPSQRSRIQHHFMAGTLRIVCATVAFGMGLDKANVRSVIHYTMPKSFENYVQEIGRAGRDGRPAHCHIFVDSQGSDLAELSKHAHSNTVDRYSIQMLLKHIFKPCACATRDQIKVSRNLDSGVNGGGSVPNVGPDNDPNNENTDADDELFEDVDWAAVSVKVDQLTKCPGHSVTFPITKLVEDVDVPEQNIATMLTYLELAPSRSWIKVKRPVSATCYIQCYGGPDHLTALAKQATTVLAAVKFYSDPSMASNELEFPYIELAARMGWDAYIVRRELRELEKRVITGYKHGVLVEFKDLSFHVHAPGNLSDDELDEVTEYLYKRIFAQKNSEIRRLKELHTSILEVSATTHYDAAHEVNEDKDKELKGKILQYFTVSTEQAEGDWENPLPDLPPAHILSVVQRDIRSFVQKYHELPLRGRVVARILQGIDSPNYPATTWGRIRQFWRKHIDVDFDWMVRCATEEIANMRLRF